MGWQFDGLLEAQVSLEDWRILYHTKRPHTSLGLLFRIEYANQRAATNPNSLLRSPDAQE